jgi:tripartite-type tricarboxylate transporter receptor subunit TctC
MSRSCQAATAGAALCMAFAAMSFAQSYPSKPVRVILPITAGSVADVAVRRLGAVMQTRLGQPWLVDLRPGGNMVPGLNACAKAAADGYTLCVAGLGGIAYAPHLVDNIPYDSAKDFKPIIGLFYVVEGLVARGSLPANSVKELQAITVRKPGAVNFGTLGSGSTNEFFRLWLNEQWKDGMAGIPYKGGGDIAQALLREEIDATRIGVGNLVPLVKSGKVKVLAVSAKSPLLPNVPTLEDVGLGAYPGGRVWWGLAAPAGTPDAVVQRLNTEVAAALSDAKLSAFLVESYLASIGGTPEQFGALMRGDLERVGQMLKRYNVQKQ